MEEKLTRFATYGALAFGLGWLAQRVVTAHNRRLDHLDSEICDVRVRVFSLENPGAGAGIQGSQPDAMEQLAIKAAAALDELVQRKRAQETAVPAETQAQ